MTLLIICVVIAVWLLVRRRRRGSHVAPTYMTTPTIRVRMGSARRETL